MVIVQSAPIIIGIIVTFMFHNFFFSSLAKSGYLSLFPLSFKLVVCRDSKVHISASSLFLLTIARSGCLALNHPGSELSIPIPFPINLSIYLSILLLNGIRLIHLPSFSICKIFLSTLYQGRQLISTYLFTYPILLISIYVSIAVC